MKKSLTISKNCIIIEQIGQDVQKVNSCDICARHIINELKQLSGIKRNLEELVKKITA